jgi:carbon starvation protein
LPVLFAAIPMVFMLAIPSWALSIDLQRWIEGGSWSLVAVGSLVLGITIWLAIEGILLWKKARGVLEDPVPEKNIVRPR